MLITATLPLLIYEVQGFCPGVTAVSDPRKFNCNTTSALQPPVQSLHWEPDVDTIYKISLLLWQWGEGEDNFPRNQQLSTKCWSSPSTASNTLMMHLIRQPSKKCFNKCFNTQPTAQPWSKDQISSNHISAARIVLSLLYWQQLYLCMSSPVGTEPLMEDYDPVNQSGWRQVIKSLITYVSLLRLLFGKGLVGVDY